MKKVFAAALCLMIAGSLCAQKKAVNQAQKLAGKPEKIEEARSLIQGAMTNPETSKQAKTYYVAGLIEFKNYDNIKGLRALQNQNDITPEMAEMLMKGYNYFVKALEYDALPDEKGKTNQYAKDIFSQIAGHDWDYFSVGAYYYNNHKYYPEAFDAFYLASDIPANPNVAGATTLMPDSARAQSYFYAGTSAYSGKEVAKALEAFTKAADLGYDDVNLPVYQLACMEVLASNDSTLVGKEKYDAAGLALAKKAYEKYGLANSIFLSKIIDNFVQNDQAQAALDYINAELAKNPNASRLYNLRGWINGRMNNDKGYLEDNLKAAQMADADADIVYDAALASFRYGRAVIGTLGISAEDKAKQQEAIKTYLEPALELAAKAKSLDSRGLYTSKIDKLISDIDYLMSH